MIGVTDQHGIDGTSRKARIIFCPDDHLNVMLTPEERSRPQEKQRKPAKIYGKNLSLFSDGRSKLEREVACPSAKVDDGISWAQVQGSKNVRRPLPLITL